MNILAFLTPKEFTAYIEVNSTIRDFLEKHDYRRFTVVPIIDEDGHFVTTVSEGDILSYLRNNASFDLSITEAELIDNIGHYRPYKALDVNCSIKDIIELSLNQNFIPMIDDRGMYIGIIKRRDIIEYFSKKFPIYEEN